MNPLQGEYIASSTLIRKVLNSGNDRILSRRYLIVGGREGGVRFSKTSLPMEIYYPRPPPPTPTPRFLFCQIEPPFSHIMPQFFYFHADV